jgi:hypothetical protein
MNPTKEPPATEPPSNGFLYALGILRGGLAATEASQALADATCACMLTGKAAKVTVTLKLTPAQKVAGALLMEDDLKVALPKAEKENSLFYPDEDGNLLRDHPKQMALEIKMVEPPKTKSA